jgi:adenylate cyclase
MMRLAELQACFEGVIPSIIATAAADGTPNISYLSHVVMIDDDHVGLSNQFFSKTAANIRENPQAALLLVDARNGEQFRLDIAFVSALSTGPVFEHVRSHLDATSAQAGMAGIFRLRGIDVYRVQAISHVPSPVVTSAALAHSASVPADSTRVLKAVARVVESIAAATDVESIVDAALDSLRAHFGYENTLLLVRDPARSILTTIGSRGYERTGIGSELPLGEGLISTAASEARVIKVSDMSRIRRLVGAVRDSSADENRTRTIAFPTMPDAMSQIAIPLVTQRQVHGVLFAESQARLAFTTDDEIALTIIARQLASALELAESQSDDAQSSARSENSARNPSDAAARATTASSVDAIPERRAPSGVFRVTHHAFDDSVFIDNQYVVKGVPGRLLIYLLETYQKEGRREFTNRELRLSTAIRLPDIKDNLESRLLLLRRRLADKALPVQLHRAGRGRVLLQLSAEPTVRMS